MEHARRNGYVHRMTSHTMMIMMMMMMLNSTQNGPFRRRRSQPIYWLVLKKASCVVQIWVSWRKRNLFDMEWLAEEKRKGEDLERERLRHVDEHMRRTSWYHALMQGMVSTQRRF